MPFYFSKFFFSSTSCSINGVSFKFSEKNLTVLQACENVGVFVPRFCYHEKLSIAGNCRMCLVEIVKSPKLVAACAMPLSMGMVIYTNTVMVQLARENIMEFLLLNHPLDCPVCDQGGECDLQNQAFVFGNDRGRTFVSKKTKSNKFFGAFVKTIMTRCIYCTRCVRFLSDVADVPLIGMNGRGSISAVGFYSLDFKTKSFFSELSGNLIDICPVGALTAKPHAYAYRNWELKKTVGVDCMNVFGVFLRFDYKGLELIRVLPAGNYWISDKTRFAYDSFFVNRLLFCAFFKHDAVFVVGWKKITTRITNCCFSHVYSTSKWFSFGFFSKNHCRFVTFFFGSFLDLGDVYSVKKFANWLGSSVFFSPAVVLRVVDFVFLFRNSFPVKIATTDGFFSVGTFPTSDFPAIFSNFYQVWQRKKFYTGVFGSFVLGSFFQNAHISTEFNYLKSLFASKTLSSLNFFTYFSVFFVSSVFFLNSVSLNFHYKFSQYFYTHSSSAVLPSISMQSLHELGVHSVKYCSFSNFQADFLFRSNKCSFFFACEPVFFYEQDTNFYFGQHLPKQIASYEAVIAVPSFLEKNSMFVNIFGKWLFSNFAFYFEGSSVELSVFFDSFVAMASKDLVFFFYGLFFGKKSFSPFFVFKTGPVYTKNYNWSAAGIFFSNSFFSNYSLFTHSNVDSDKHSASMASSFFFLKKKLNSYF